MIDFLKMEVPPYRVAGIRRNPLLDFARNTNEDHGNVHTEKPRVARFQNMTFRIWDSGRCLLMGSLHKYFHNGINSNDFTFEECRTAIQQLCNQFELDPAELKIIQLEAGLNIPVHDPFDSSLKSFVCLSDGVEFLPMPTIDKGYIGVEAKRTQYTMKLYNKIRSINGRTEVFRAELKMIGSRYCGTVEARVLSDLLKYNVWHGIKERLLEQVQSIIIIEPGIDLEKLSLNHLLWLHKAKTAIYWKKLKPKVRYKQRERLASLTGKFGGPVLRKMIEQGIEKKFHELVDDAILKEQKIGDVFKLLFAKHEIQNRGCFQGLYTVGNHSLEPVKEEGRKCRTCGRDISAQSERSIFCSEKEFGKSAKRCRNKQSNPVHNRLKTLRKYMTHPVLFDFRPFVRGLPEELSEKSKTVFYDELRELCPNFN